MSWYTLAATIKHKSAPSATALIAVVAPLLMVMGLLAPALGPALDHHYVDRSPVHGHVFLGAATNDHTHVAELAFGNHDHSSGVNGDGVSVLSTSVSSAHSPLTSDGTTLESIIPRYDSHMTALYVSELPDADGQAIAPLGRPPRLG